MVKEMEMEFGNLMKLKVIFMKASTNLIKSMAMEYTNGLMVQPMKEVSEMI